MKSLRVDHVARPRAVLATSGFSEQDTTAQGRCGRPSSQAVSPGARTSPTQREGTHPAPRSRTGRVSTHCLTGTGDGAICIIATSYYTQGDLLGHLERAQGFRGRLFKSRWRFPSRQVAREAVSFFCSRRVWRDYAPRWPKHFVSLAGLWWSG